MLKKILALGIGLCLALVCYAGGTDPGAELDSFEFGSFTLLLLVVVWIALPFAVFRVNPYSLFKAAFETRRMYKQADDAKSQWEAAPDVHSR